MRVLGSLKIALWALQRNKMRSVLTTLGIIIGVGAVIAMVGIGNGAKAQVEAQIASLGQNVILIFAGSITSSGLNSRGLFKALPQSPRGNRAAVLESPEGPQEAGHGAPSVSPCADGAAQAVWRGGRAAEGRKFPERIC